MVALGIELGVHNVVVDEFNNSEHSVDIVLHIGHLDVRDCVAGRELLELSLERKLCERIDRDVEINLRPSFSSLSLAERGDSGKYNKNKVCREGRPYFLWHPQRESNP